MVLWLGYDDSFDMTALGKMPEEQFPLLFFHQLHKMLILLPGRELKTLTSLPMESNITGRKNSVSYMPSGSKQN